MNTKNLKNLRVAVVPTETNNNIDQNSTVEEILACDETVLVPITDYFKGQNDEEFDVLHWSFLIDIVNKIDLTGCNIDGIHQNSNDINISVIKQIINEYGNTTSKKLDLDEPPTLFNINNGMVNVSEIVEDYREDGVETITYQDDKIVGYSYYEYEELTDEIISDIKEVIEIYEADYLKTEKRCED